MCNFFQKGNSVLPSANLYKQYEMTSYNRYLVTSRRYKIKKKYRLFANTLPIYFHIVFHVNFTKKDPKVVTNFLVMSRLAYVPYEDDNLTSLLISRRSRVQVPLLTPLKIINNPFIS